MQKSDLNKATSFIRSCSTLIELGQKYIFAIRRSNSDLTLLYEFRSNDLELSFENVKLAKAYKLKHLSKVEAVSTDLSGCTFILVWTCPLTLIKILKFIFSFSSSWILLRNLRVSILECTIVSSYKTFQCKVLWARLPCWSVPSWKI